jgi:hypothetical protein
VEAKEQSYYVLLCRHARHDDGRLLAVKDGEERWRFPTGSVARALAEQLVIGKDRLRLAKVVYAPTPEASRTAALLLRGLRGEPNDVDKQPPSQPHSVPQSVKVMVAAPAWLPDSDSQKAADLGACGYKVSHEPWEDLLPNRLYETKTGAAQRIQDELDDLEKTGRSGDGCNALLVVGHQPQMGWLSCYLSAERRSGWRSGAIPLAPSEVACVRLRRGRDGWRGSLAWTLVPDDKDALKDVVDKVKGKMESAKLLSAVITLALTALLGVLLDSSRWAGLGAQRASLAGLSYSGKAAIQIAFVLLLSALALYLLTMYSYDRLLMPTRFWAEGPDREGEETGPDVSSRPSVVRWLVRRRTRGPWLPRRPPSSSAWVVLRNMQRIWFWMFTPANVLVALALAILAAALLRLHGWVWVPVALFAIVVTVWAWWFRPVLGSED